MGIGNILGIIFKLIGWFTGRKSQKIAEQKEYDEFVEVNHKKGIASTKTRLDAEAQKKDIDGQWKERNEKKAKDDKEGNF